MHTPDSTQSTYRPFRKLGERLKQARLQAGYTSQPQLARVLGINHNTINRHECGHVLPVPRILRKYCEVLRLEEAELQYGVGGFVPPPGAVVDFLMSRDAQALLDETRDRLLRVNWSAFSAGITSRSDVAVVARLIDRNLRRRGHSQNVELSGRTAHLPGDARTAHL